MQLNEIHIEILTAALARMSHALEHEIATGTSLDNSPYICDNIAVVVSERLDLENRRLWVNARDELLYAIQTALDNYSSFAVWAFQQETSSGVSIWRLLNPTDTPCLMQQARCAWIERMLATGEIK